MKQIIITTLVMLTLIITDAQSQTPHWAINYDAANWKLWFIDKPQLITIPAPPGTTESMVELQSLKRGMNKLDEKKLAAIKYWDAGAPSYRWNQIAPKLIDRKPETMLRIPTAWMNIAIYDATILAWKEKIHYKRKRPHSLDPQLPTIIVGPQTYSFPCEHSVTAAAAAYVLAYFFPEKSDSILQLARAASQSRIDAGVQFASDVEAGWKLGQEVAKLVIEIAKNDGSGKVWKGIMNKDPKKWTGSFAMGAGLASFTPIIIQRADQFRPQAPPDFENEMKDLKNFKKTFKSASLAYYWANNGGFDFWSDLASQKMFENRMTDDAPAVARIYAVLNTAYHDAAISIFDAKYTYWGIRPFQYDSTYKSLIPTPPFPGYPSGHATGASTSSTVLAYFFPADAKQFHQLAQDCADSRFYAGIHFRVDNETGLRMGKEIGNYVVETWMKK